MYRARWTAHSSFCSTRIAPTRRTRASSLGKMPTTSVRRLISAVDAFERIGGMQLGAMLRRERLVGGHVRLGRIALAYEAAATGSGLRAGSLLVGSRLTSSIRRALRYHASAS